jgi:hypothetical protein
VPYPRGRRLLKAQLTILLSRPGAQLQLDAPRGFTHHELVHGCRFRCVAALIVSFFIVVAPAQAGRAWRTAAELPTTGDSPYWTSLTMTPAGEAVGAWTDSTDGKGAVRGFVAPPDGSAPSGKLLESWGFNPSVASDGAGNALVAFSDEKNHTILGSDRPPGGSFSDTYQLVAPVHSFVFPKLAMRADGAAAMSFADAWGDVYAASRPAIGTFGAPVDVSGPMPVQPQWDRVTAITSDGRAIVVWAQGNDVRAAVQTPAGPFAPAVTLSATGREGEYPRLAVDGHGRAVVLWQETDLPRPTADPGVYETSVNGALKVAWLDTDALAFGPSAVIAGADRYAAEGEVGMTADGRAIAAFTKSDSDNRLGEIVASEAAFGGSFSTPHSLTDGYMGDAVRLRVTPTGEAVAGWRLFGERDGLESSRRDPSGSWDSPQDIVRPCPANEPYLDALAIDPTGRASALFRTFDGPATGIQVALDEPTTVAPPRQCAGREDAPRLNPSTGSQESGPASASERSTPADPPAAAVTPAPERLHPATSGLAIRTVRLSGRGRSRTLVVGLRCRVRCRVKLRLMRATLDPKAAPTLRTTRAWLQRSALRQVHLPVPAAVRQMRMSRLDPRRLTLEVAVVGGALTGAATRRLLPYGLSCGRASPCGG